MKQQGWPLLAILSCAACWRRAVGLELRRNATPAERAKQPFDVNRSCEPEWRKDTAVYLRGVFEQDWAGKVAEVFSKMGGPVMMAVGEARTNTLFRNFMIHAQNMSITDDVHRIIVYVALDTGGYSNCEEVVKELKKDKDLDGRTAFRRLRLVCVDLHGWLPREYFQSDEEKSALMGAPVSSCAYNVIIWSKPHILTAAVEACPHGVMLIDSDVVLYHDLMNVAQDIFQSDNTTQIVAATEYKYWGTFSFVVNTGVVYATKASMRILKMWLDWDADYLNDKAGDEGALIDMFRNKNRRKGMRRISTEVLGQCAERGSHATHYNCYGNKLRPMKNNQDWKIPDKGVRLVKGDMVEDLAAHAESSIQAIQEAGDWWVVDVLQPWGMEVTRSVT